MRTEKLALVTVSMLAMVASASAQVLWQDDFESYADSAAMMAVGKWGDDGATGAPMVLVDDPLYPGNPGKWAYHSGGNNAASSVPKHVFAATVPTNANPILWQTDIYFDGVGNKRMTAGLRDNGAGATLGAILEMGAYNDTIDPETSATFKYSTWSVRNVFIGGPAGWTWYTYHKYSDNSILTYADTPAGWHTMRALIGLNSIKFEFDIGADGTWDAVRQIAVTNNAKAYNVAHLGGPSGANTSAGGGVGFDNFRVEIVPEPATLGLLFLGAIPLLRRRRTA